MIKITIEEVEILITARVEDNLKQNIPKIKQVVDKIKQQFEKVDMGDFSNKTKQAVQQVNQEMSKINSNGTSKNLQAGFEKAGQAVERYKKQLEQANEKLRQVYAQMDNKVEQAWQSAMPEGLDKNNPQAEKAIEPVVNNALSNDKDYQSLLSQENKLNAKIEELNLKINEAKSNYANLGSQIQQVENSQDALNNNASKFGQMISKSKTQLKGMMQNFKTNGVQQFKNAIAGIPNALKKVHGALSTLKGKAQEAFSNNRIKLGIGQVFKYAGALFSLRSIYNALSSSASSWLSSQNAQAKQLSANIEYMKYAVGSAFAPVIEYIVNLVYQLLKGIQSVIYALFRVNIFANASASSYNSMAKSANKTAKSTKEAQKALAGFDEINNIGGNDNNGSGDNAGTGSGNVGPSFDLSEVDTSIWEGLKDLDFEELGKTLGENLNKALEKIDWGKIQSTAKTIAEKIAGFINGFVGATNWDLVGYTIGQGINTAFIFADTLLTTINFEKIGQSLAKSLNSMISTIDWKLVGKTFADSFNAVFDVLYGFLSTFDWKEFGKAIAEGINSFFKNIKWDKVAKTISEAIKGLFDTVTGFLENFDWSIIIDGLITFVKNIDWGGIANSIFQALGSACASLVNLGMVIGEYIGKAFDGIGKYFNDKIEECGGNVVLGILKGIVDAVIGIGQWIYEHIFKPFIDGFKNAFKIHSPSQVMEDMAKFIVDGFFNGLKNIWDKVKSIFTTLKDNIGKTFTDTLTKIKQNFSLTAIKKHFEGALTKIKTIFANIHTWFKDKFGSVVSKIKEKFSFNTIKSHFGKVLSGIKSVFSGIPNWFRSTFSSAWQKVKNVFSKGGKVFSGIKEGILGTFKKIVNGLINGINRVIKIPFDGINRALSRIRDINILGKRPFSGLPTISVPQIPKLATGNVATEETLAIFGEYAGAKSNPEVTAPQNIIYETTKQAIMDSSNSSGQNVDNSTPRNIVIRFGSYRVAYELEELRRKAQRQNGTATISI